MSLRLSGSTATIKRSTALRLYGFTATKGFTLVEITLVVGILVVLSAIVLVTLNIRGNRANVHNVQRKMDVETIQKALDLRAQETGDSLPDGLVSGLGERCIGTGSDTFNLNQIDWTENPIDANIVFDVGLCGASDCSDVSWLGQNYSIPSAITGIPDSPYFQYKAIFNVSELAWTQFDASTSKDGFNFTGNGSPSVGMIISNTMVDMTDNSVKLSVAGTGADGALDLSFGCSGTGLEWSSSTCTINTDTKSIFNFTNINIPVGTILTATGSNKLTLYAAGSVTISGTIDLNGGSAGSVNTSFGIGIAGGGNGGQGGDSDGDPPGYAASGIGKGPDGIGGGSRPNLTQSGHGGGGGFGALGSSGTTGASGGSLYGSDTDVWYGGSGGGGGHGSTQANARAGGAGGGALRIISANNITINTTGIIKANGGAGAGSSYNGGGGSGGGILLQAGSSISNAGSIQAKGGGGPGSAGEGAGGRVRMETFSGTGISLGVVVTSSCTGAAGTVDVCGGSSNYGTATLGSFSPGYYPTSGTYMSGIYNISAPAIFTSNSWTALVPDDGEVTLNESDLNGLWHINENSGQNVKDSTGLNNGTMNSDSWGAGKFGNASLLANGNYINISDNDVLDIGNGDWTVELWIKPSTTGSGKRTIISKAGATSAYYIEVNASGKIIAGIKDDLDIAEAAGVTGVTDGSWHHVVLVYLKSIGRANLYIDGKLDGSGSSADLANTLSNTVDLRIGADNTGANPFSGEIDEVALYGSALSGPEALKDCTTDPLNDICAHYGNRNGLPHLKFQVRSCDDYNCDTEQFVGPNGSADTFYNSVGLYGSGSSLIIPNNRYVQYKAFFATSDGTKTPAIDSISIKYLNSDKPQLLNVTIGAISVSLGLLNSFSHTSYNDFTNLGKLTIPPELTVLGSSDPGNADAGKVEYAQGVAAYTSPVFSGSCYNLATDLAPLYLGTIPKDPKDGTDANTGYLISVDPATKVVCVKAPGAENNEVIENCRK